ncbi:MAG: SPASM domain-containing protein [Polyangiaceae bacterium]|nr:SPASM domain-containing protein [Polyangiaceae bacterium]
MALPRCFWPHTSMVIRYDGDVIPCCSYRLGKQYSTDGERRTMGNVFDVGVKAVWDSLQFRQARRMVSRPNSVEKEPELKDHFCYGCDRIFDTIRQENARNSELSQAGPVAA